MTRSAFASVALRVLAVIAAVLVVVTVRVVAESRNELARAARAEDRSDVDAAVVHYRRAARWDAPFNPFSSDALDALFRLGRDAERANDRARALEAYRGVRAAVLAARSLYIPHEAALHRANSRIADLMAAEPAPAIDAGKSHEQIRREHLALLEEPIRPSPIFGLVALLGFVTWASAAYLMFTRGVDEEDGFVLTEARLWGTMFIVGFGLFLLGLALA